MMCPTIVAIALTLTLNTSGSNSLPDTTLQNASSIATIAYTFINLIIVIVAIWSLALTRKQMRENKKQSNNAIAVIHEQIKVSEVQSQAAITAIHDQIEASKQQSQDAIAAVHEQIKASEMQAQETLYNQHRPLLVCSYHPMSETAMSNMPMPIKNVGLGIALNIRGILSITSSIWGQKFQTGFIIPSVLTPGSDPEMVSINPLGMKDVIDKIGKHSFFPDDKDSSYNQRLVLTYHDIFNRKHLSIYDGRLGTNWKVYRLETNFEWSIEDLCPDSIILSKTTYGTVNGL
jgi:hypothetical protein